MNERELSRKLEELANKVEHSYNSNLEAYGQHYADSVLLEISNELRQLSNQNYAPGSSVSWGDVKKQAMSTQLRFPF